MSRLDDLQRDISKMSTDELGDLFRQIRADRKIRRETVGSAPKKRAKSANPAQDMKAKVKNFMANMSPEERMALLKRLGGKS